MRGSLQSALAGHRAYDQTDITSLQKASSSIRLRSMRGSGHASRMFDSGEPALATCKQRRSATRLGLHLDRLAQWSPRDTRMEAVTQIRHRLRPIILPINIPV
jgi:hypothetical protein